MTPSEGTLRGPQLARNSLLNLAAFGVPLVVAALCMPIVVRRMDGERFGLLTLAWTILNYFGVFDLGLGRAATKFVAEALGRGERHRLRALVGSAVLLQAVSGLVGAVALAALAPTAASRFFHVPPDLLPEAQRCFWWLSISLPVVFVSGTLFGALEAAQRFDRTSAIRLPAGSATFLVPVCGVIANWSLPTIVALLVATRFATLVALWWACRREFPEIRGTLRTAPSELRPLLRFGGWLTVSSVVAPLLVSLDRFFLGSILGLTAIARYAAPSEIVNRLLVVPVSLVGTLFPAWSALQGSGEHERFERLAARACRFLLVLLGPGLVAMAALAPDLMRVWLGPEWAGDSGRALAILCAGVLATALAQVPYAVLHAVGRPDRTALFHLIELPIHAVVLWVAVRAWGVPGAALAWSLRAGFDAILLFAAAHRLAPLDRHTLQTEGVLRAVTLILLLAVVALAVAAATNGISRWVAVLALATIGAWFGWRRVLHPADRALVLRGLVRGGAT